MTRAHLVSGVTAAVLACVGGSGVMAQSRETAAPGYDQKGVDEREERITRQGERYAGSGAEFHQGQWSSGGSVGVLGSTPDGTALALNGNVEYFIEEHVSFGPLLQMGFTDDLTQVGLSGQGKYWIDVPGTNGRGKANLQAGVGFVHADMFRSDTSWLIPLGVGYDYTLDSGVSVTGAALLNFTNLDVGRDADVMPGIAFGVRF